MYLDKYCEFLMHLNVSQYGDHHQNDFIVLLAVYSISIYKAVCVIGTIIVYKDNAF